MHRVAKHGEVVIPMGRDERRYDRVVRGQLTPSTCGQCSYTAPAIQGMLLCIPGSGLRRHYDTCDRKGDNKEESIKPQKAETAQPVREERLAIGDYVQSEYDAQVGRVMEIISGRTMVLNLSKYTVPQRVATDNYHVIDPRPQVGDVWKYREGACDSDDRLRTIVGISASLATQATGKRTSVHYLMENATLIMRPQNTKQEGTLAVGDMVRYTNKGPFENIVGTVVELTSNNRVKVRWHDNMSISSLRQTSSLEKINPTIRVGDEVAISFPRETGNLVDWVESHGPFTVHTRYMASYEIARADGKHRPIATDLLTLVKRCGQ